MIEQRKNRRFELRLPFEILRHGNLFRVRGETRNMSSSGVLFTSEGDVMVGEPIEYSIKFPRTPSARSEIRLRCVGTVLREDGDANYAVTLERYEFIRNPV